MSQSPERVALVTGTLAEPALRRVAGELAESGAINPRVIVLNIQVAALMTADWVARKLELPAGGAIDRVILPGHCRGDVTPIAGKLGVPVETGPTDLHDLPEMFGQKRGDAEDLEKYDIEILAEINHAPRMGLEQILAMAEGYRADGADVIDLGCDPVPPGSGRAAWPGVRGAVRELRARGFRVSIDSFHHDEVAAATAEGAELVLSINTSNAAAAEVHGAEVVVIPDEPKELRGLDEAIATLESRGIRYRIDPIIEPIGFGFAESLGRYLEVRRRLPRAELMMGVGNLTEMTETDSVGVNTLLAGFCQEVGVRSVLTTQVINWARSSVKELDLARRVMRHAVTRRTPPKRVDDRLVMLRDPKLRAVPDEELAQLAAGLTDRNLRIFAAGGKLHVMNKDFHLTGDDPFEIFDRMPAGALDASHAFYIGYEMAKAVTALTLGKNYTQDRALRWGVLTREEKSAHERRRDRGA